MPIETNQKITKENRDFSGKISQERAYEILSQGVVLTMEDDLKNETKRKQIKADLIPNDSPQKQQEAVFSEKPIFDPFLELKNLSLADEQEKKEEKDENLKSNNASKEPPKQQEQFVVKQEIKEEEESFNSLKPIAEEKDISTEQKDFNKAKKETAQKIFATEAGIKEIATSQALLLERKKAILEKIKLQKSNLEFLVAKTEDIKNKQTIIEKQEQEAKDGISKRNFEEQRWHLEEDLKKAQDIQWAQEEEIEKSQMALAKVESSLKLFNQQKEALTKEKFQQNVSLQNFSLMQQKRQLIDKNKNFIEQKNQIEQKFNEATIQKEKAAQELVLIVSEEAEIEKEEKRIQAEIQNSIQLAEKRKLEQERREIAQKRQIQEKKRWEAERKQETANNNFILIKEQFEKIKKEDGLLSQKVLEIDAKTKIAENKPPKEETTSSVVDFDFQKAINQNQESSQENDLTNKIPKLEEVVSNEKEIIEKIRLKAKAKEQELIQEQITKQQIAKEKQALSQEYKTEQEEKNREKAIATLKQIAQQEQLKAESGKLRGPILKEEILRKLSKNSLQEETNRKEFLLRINKKAKPLPKQRVNSFEENVIFHPMIKKSSLFEKIIVRFLIVVFVFGGLFGVYFGIVEIIKNQQEKQFLKNNEPLSTTSSEGLIQENWPEILPQSSTTQSTIENSSSTQSIETKATSTIPIISEPLISVATNNIFSYTGDNELAKSSMKSILEGEIEYNVFEQISVLNEENQTYLRPYEIFAVLEAVLPGETLLVKATSTMVVFSSKFGNRLGFIAQTEDAQKIKNSFLSQERQAEQNTESIFILMGKTVPAIKKYFSAISYKKVPIRCQTFTKEDLGICYFAYKNYFVWTSSLEQASRIVDKLE